MAALDEITNVIAEIIEEFTGIPAADVDRNKTVSYVVSRAYRL
ncbi:hypothetical protein OHO83_00640 [Streptomyces sp. NBC_00569]|nr:hypothetical protein [Streptomyces sp. NBC_00569]WUB90954.1 hypothetical protein OHO83_00640 [Streptomyces sp. NBC_00569]